MFGFYVSWKRLASNDRNEGRGRPLGKLYEYYKIKEFQRVRELWDFLDCGISKLKFFCNYLLR